MKKVEIAKADNRADFLQLAMIKLFVHIKITLHTLKFTIAYNLLTSVFKHSPMQKFVEKRWSSLW